MKKGLLILLLAISFVKAESSEFGLGAIFDNGNSASLAIKYNEWKLDVDGGSIAVDHLFIERSLSGGFNWFMGLGGYTAYDLSSFGARLPIGIDYDFSDSFDIFVEIIPAVSLNPNFGNFGTGVDGGIRIFF